MSTSIYRLPKIILPFGRHRLPIDTVSCYFARRPRLILPFSTDYFLGKWGCYILDTKEKTDSIIHQLRERGLCDGEKELKAQIDSFFKPERLVYLVTEEEIMREGSLKKVTEMELRQLTALAAGQYIP